MTVPEPNPRLVFTSLLDVWRSGDVRCVLELVTDDYVGHMLHLTEVDRSKEMYPARISQFRVENPGTSFRVVEQRELSDGLFSRLIATRGDGAHSYGMNQSRLVGSLIAEEWAVWSDWRRA